MLLQFLHGARTNDRRPTPKKSQELRLAPPLYVGLVGHGDGLFELFPGQLLCNIASLSRDIQLPQGMAIKKQARTIHAPVKVLVSSRLASAQNALVHKPAVMPALQLIEPAHILVKGCGRFLS